jgi:hypothetical protein
VGILSLILGPRLLAQLRRLASKQSKPYQTLIHELLERATKKVAQRRRMMSGPCSSRLSLRQGGPSCNWLITPMKQAQYYLKSKLKILA